MAKGPPPLLLRALGPVIVVSAVVLLATGVALLAMGPGGGLRDLHKFSFIVLFATLSVHVLAHLRKLPLSPRPIGAGARGCPAPPPAARS